MPLVRISLREGKSEAYRRAIGEAVHRAMEVPREKWAFGNGEAQYAS